MSEELFTQKLRDFLQRTPFLPFYVELNNGERLFVDYPSVAFSGGGAAFLTEGGFVPFDCEEVKSITLATAETTS